MTDLNDYTTVFEYKTLTKIIGEPTRETLDVLFNELKANAGMINTDLGGGAHGHLGLLLSAAKYDTIAPGTPYTRPAHPGPLVIPAGTAQHAAYRMTLDHQRDVKAYNATIEIEKALIKQIVEAIDKNYLLPLRN